MNGNIIAHTKKARKTLRSARWKLDENIAKPF